MDVGALSGNGESRRGDPPKNAGDSRSKGPMTTTFSRAILFVLCACSLPGLSACGARSELETGGAAGSSGTTTVTPTALACDEVSLVEPLFVVKSIGLAYRPQLSPLPSSGDVLLSYIAADQDDVGPIEAGRLSPFSAWPPEVTDVESLTEGVLDFAVGAGPQGAVALIHGVESDRIATKLYPTIEETGIEVGKDDLEKQVLFAATAGETFLGAFASTAVTYVGQAPDTVYNTARVASYVPGFQPQVEGPDICMLTDAVGAAVPSNGGVLAAFAVSPPSQKSCDKADLLWGTVLSVVRYDLPAAPGAPLSLTQGAQITGTSDIALIGMAPASFGAWVVYRRTDKTGPQSAIFAIRVDAAGNLLTPGEAPIAVSSLGLLFPSVGVAALGDSLIVAAVDKTSIPAPTVEIQVVRPDGTLGKATTIDTSDAVVTGRITLQPSPDGGKLLLAWEDKLGGAGIVLARADCVSAL